MPDWPHGLAVLGGSLDSDAAILAPSFSDSCETRSDMARISGMGTHATETLVNTD